MNINCTFRKMTFEDGDIFAGSACHDNCDSGDESGDNESDDEVNGSYSSSHDPDWSCDCDGYESSGSESDDANDESEKVSKPHQVCQYVISSNV